MIVKFKMDTYNFIEQIYYDFFSSFKIDDPQLTPAKHKKGF